jgi:hypothetical protein
LGSPLVDIFLPKVFGVLKNGQKKCPKMKTAKKFTQKKTKKAVESIMLTNPFSDETNGEHKIFPFFNHGRRKGIKAFF